MARTYSAIKNKHLKRSKVNYRSYFGSPNEPRERMSTYVPAELEVELLESSDLMRHKFRRLARTMRNQYA